MDQAFERSAGDSHEIVHIMATEHMNQPGIGIENLFLFISPVHKNTAGHAIHDVLQNGCISQ